MIVSINQPAYLPWLGYFHRIGASDVHIILDHVQYEKNSFTNRNKIRTSTGWAWLTVPVRIGGKFGTAIHELDIDNSQGWRRKHLETLQQNYSRAPHFAEHQAFFAELYRREWTKLSDLCQEITRYLLGALNISTRLLLSSQMEARGHKDELVLNLCQEVGADVYLSGALGKNYLREPLLTAAGIAVQYQDYVHPTYAQAYPKFEPLMAAIDLLFNCGPTSSQILMAEQEPVTR